MVYDVRKGGVNVKLSITEMIRVLAKRKGVPVGYIAECMGHTRQNLCNKMRKNEFKVTELEQIASAVGCHLELHFVDNATGNIVI